MGSSSDVTMGGGGSTKDDIFLFLRCVRRCRRLVSTIRSAMPTSWINACKSTRTEWPSLIVTVRTHVFRLTVAETTPSPDTEDISSSIWYTRLHLRRVPNPKVTTEVYQIKGRRKCPLLTLAWHNATCPNTARSSCGTIHPLSPDPSSLYAHRSTWKGTFSKS